jgi:tetratricopeptide (TPR) repeat protein
MTVVSHALAAATAQYRTGQLTEAEETCRQILAGDSNCAPAWHCWGLVAMQRGNWSGAIQHIGRAVALHPGYAEAHSSLGNAYQRSGKLHLAYDSHRRAAELLPQSAEAQFNLGNAAHALGNTSEAIDHFQRAIALQPDAAPAHCNLGVVYQKQGNLSAAIASYERVLAIHPNHVAALINLGNAHKQAGKLPEAIPYYRRALELEPTAADAHYNLGATLQQLGELERAALCYQQAIQLKPDHASAYNNLGNIFRERNRLEEAIACYDRAIKMTPARAEIHNNLGVTLRDLKRSREAIACFQTAISLDPNAAELHSNLGNALKDEGMLDEAIACYLQSLALKSDEAMVHDNLALAYLDQGNLDAAASCFRRSGELNPDSPHLHWCQSMLLLLTGDFQRGWPEHEWRWRCPDWRRYTGEHLPDYPQPVWNGSRLDGKTILLQAEQGFGDTIQFVRYVLPVKQAGGHVILQCQSALLPLLSRCGADQVVGRIGDVPPFDCRAALMSLPAIFQTTLDTIPSRVPYLLADPALVASWREKLRPILGFRVGINWRGRGGAGIYRRRDIPLQHFEPLAQIPGVRLVSLHKGDSDPDIASQNERPFYVDLGADLDAAHGAFMDTAAVMMSLDLVITSDTAIAHLAGALGVPVWLALSFAADWRWLLDRGDNPWYPTMRLFRQKRPGDWTGPFEEIFGALNAAAKRAQ